jgi:hypothetical protein
MKKSFWYTIALSSAAFLLSSCGLSVIQGSGRIISQDRAVSFFNQVDLQGSGDIILTQGDAEAMRVEADDNIMDYIKTEVRGDTLYVGFKDYRGDTVWPSQSIKYYITMNTIKGLTLTGSGTISAKQVNALDLGLTINGSGDILLDALTANSVDCTIRGSGKCVLAGKVGSQTAAIIGSGKYLADRLESQTAIVSIAGSGNITVRVAESLDVTITGSGDVTYYGKPSVSEHITGSGNVRGQKEV